MKYETIKVTSDGYGLEDVLEEAEAVAEIRSLPKKDALHLRLLAEEMLCMLRSVTGRIEADFWIEEERNCFELHLSADTVRFRKHRKDLLSVSTSGTNAAARGILGWIRDIYEAAFMPEDEYFEEARKIISSIPHTESTNPYYDSSTSIYWSLRKYKENVEKDKDRTPASNEAWNELEKSVIASLADEVSIGITGKHVDMIVYMHY